MVEIKDITGENAGTLNQALAFPVKASGETLVVILLGIDIRKSLEIFEDEFEVRTAVKTKDDLISLNEYYAQLDNDEDNLFDQENFKLLSERALSFREQNGSRFSSKDTELGSSITLLPLSAFLSADDAQLFIFKDERENILIAQSILNYTYAIAIISVLILISLVAFVTTRTFGGISRAIEVLDGLTKGDHTQEMPPRKGILSSETDEVGQLSTALKSYKSHLLEMDRIRTDQAAVLIRIQVRKPLLS